jgi:phospholipid/cholesterol/gamma-HCH transport system permease protein
VQAVCEKNETLRDDPTLCGVRPVNAPDGRRGDRDDVTFTLEGRITAYTVSAVWGAMLETLTRNPDCPIIVDASKLEYIDDTGIALIFDLKRRERPPGAEVEIRGLAPNLASLVPAYDAAGFARPVGEAARVGSIEQIGRTASRHVGYFQAMAGFLGNCGAALARSLRRPGIIRWGEVLGVATEAGANAVPIVMLIGFLMGVIIAFEIGLVAQQFGAVIFVVNGVGVAMLRELGALMTAIVFAGRTGAAFAAQIGTQKVNEEVNAILTGAAAVAGRRGGGAAADGSGRRGWAVRWRPGPPSL